ncbi:MAG: phospholipid carrier-dependent glycosyltransferase [Victivallaceae bacterium]|nr:phospholipid carrier-dependent glycosyltransferase [Victivallaceae bacterium]
MNEKTSGVVRATIAVAMAGVLYLGTIWQRPLFSPDEVRYAEIAREMISSGNTAISTLAYFPYFEKPASAHYLNALSLLMFGEIPGAVRFFPALATLLTALAIAAACRRFRMTDEGVAAPCMFLSSVLVFGVGTYGVLDSQFMLFTTASLLAFAMSEDATTEGRKFLWLLLCGAATGAGFLVKGLLAPVLAVSAIGVYWIARDRSWKSLLRIALACSVGFAVLALPVAIHIHRGAPDFWGRFFYIEHWQRAISGRGASDSRAMPFLFYVAVLFLGSMPWTPFAVPMVRGLAGRPTAGKREDALLWLSVIAVVVWTIFFSFMRAKLVTYILVACPFLAIAGASGLVREGCSEKILRIISLVMLCAALALPIWQYAAMRLFPNFDPELRIYGRGEHFLPMVLGLALCALWCHIASTERNKVRQIATLSVGMGCALLPIHGFMPSAVVRSHTPAEFIRLAVLPDISDKTVIFADGTTAAAACWTAKRPVVIFRKPQELSFGMERSKIKPVRAEEVGPLGEKSQEGAVALTTSKGAVSSLSPARRRATGRKTNALFYGKTGTKSK